MRECSRTPRTVAGTGRPADEDQGRDLQEVRHGVQEGKRWMLGVHAGWSFEASDDARATDLTRSKRSNCAS